MPFSEQQLTIVQNESYRKPTTSKRGQPPYDELFMFKILIQSLMKKQLETIMIKNEAKMKDLREIMNKKSRKIYFLEKCQVKF